jgi:hypothetical protein
MLSPVDRETFQVLNCSEKHHHNWDWNPTFRLNLRDVILDILKEQRFAAAAKELQLAAWTALQKGFPFGALRRKRLRHVTSRN